MVSWPASGSALVNSSTNELLRATRPFRALGPLGRRAAGEQPWTAGLGSDRAGARAVVELR